MIKNIISSVAVVLAVFFWSAAVVAQPASALSSAPNCTKNEKSVFGIVPWYRGLLTGDDCSVTVPGGTNKTSANVTSFVMMIALNILQAGLAVAAYVTVFFIIKGGFMYMTSTGSHDGMSSAKKTIMNAIIGLLIAVLSAAIVNAIAGAIK